MVGGRRVENGVFVAWRGRISVPSTRPLRNGEFSGFGGCGAREQLTDGELVTHVKEQAEQEETVNGKW
jgi:hypothetical protein